MTTEIQMSSIIIGRPGVFLSGGGGGSVTEYIFANFLLRDDFLVDVTAPLTSPRTCLPGPGTLTITDTNNKLSVATGKLTFATGGVGASDPAVWGQLLSRLAGRALVLEITPANTGSNTLLGWDANQTGILTDRLAFGGSSVMTVSENTSAGIDVGSYAAATSYLVAFVMRGTGAFVAIKGGTFTNWTLLWVLNVGSNDRYAAVAALSSTAIATLDNFRVIDLPAPFATDYGLATQQLAGARSAADLFTHEADHHVGWTQTAVPSADYTDICVRYQDDDNTLVYEVASDGSLTLWEVVATTWTSRGSVAPATVANGHRCVGIAVASVIRVYSNNVLRITYSSASVGASRTAGKVLALGTGGAASDLVSWPRTLSGAAAAILDAAVA